MERLFIIFLTVMFVSPVMADRPKLKGPSSPKSQKITKIDTKHHCDHFRKHYIRHRKHTHRSRQPIVIIVQPKITLSIDKEQKQQTHVESRHKTIYIEQKSKDTVYVPKTRNQIIQESKNKVKPQVYNTKER
jgi:hypothetical protein